MKKAEFVYALDQFHEGSKFAPTSKGQTILAKFLADYFKKLHIPVDQEYDFWSIGSFLPGLLLGAVEEFRSSPIEPAPQLRALYELEVGRPFPHLTSVGADDVLEQAMGLLALESLIVQVTREKWIGTEIRTLFSAEQTLMLQRFREFIYRVHRAGLYELITNSGVRGMSGEFGETWLHSYVMAGRLMFTFVRGNGEYTKDVTYACEADDPLAMSAGLQSCTADLVTALSMFSDVINEWPTDMETQAEVYVTDRAVVLS